MNQYTKGEWQAQRDYPKLEDIFIIAVEPNKGGRSICKIVRQHLPETTEANARLIASAPGMYEALKEAILLLATELHIHPDNPILKTVVDMGHKALAKAEGK